jgi:hypothetical protein
MKPFCKINTEKKVQQSIFYDILVYESAEENPASRTVLKAVGFQFILFVALEFFCLVLEAVPMLPISAHNSKG